MQLELRHLAPFLPYGLEFNDDELDPESGTYGTMMMLSTFSVMIAHQYDFTNLELPLAKDGKGKPLLRSLSKLNQEIEVGGEKFVPMEKLLKINLGQNPEDMGDIIFEGPKPPNPRISARIREDIILEFCPIKIAFSEFDDGLGWYAADEHHMLVEKLFEWHFDVFGLIDNGLAIEK